MVTTRPTKMVALHIRHTMLAGMDSFDLSCMGYCLVTGTRLVLWHCRPYTWSGMIEILCTIVCQPLTSSNLIPYCADRSTSDSLHLCHAKVMREQVSGDMRGSKFFVPSILAQRDHVLQSNHGIVISFIHFMSLKWKKAGKRASFDETR
jgi:hypothetical protein